MLRFTALEDMARIVYRAEHRADPVPKITPGTISGGAACVEETLR
jgi:hypothetical protein